MKAKFVRMEWENQLRTIASFYFEPLGIYRYEAGQYAVLSVPHDDFDNRGYQRTMTLSSSPTDKLLRFTMRLLPTGGSSSKRALVALQPGAEITIYESMGDLVLPLDATIPLVFIAGGVGIASFTGMTQWLVDNQEHRSLTLHYTVARPGDVCMQQPFNNYASQYGLERIIYLPSGGKIQSDIAVSNARLNAGHITANASKECLFYVSGTEKMVEDIVHGLLNDHIARANIIFDYFDGYSDDS